MKRLIALTILSTLGLFQPPDLRADDLFQLFWRGTYYTHDGSGHIIAVRLSEADIVAPIAQNNNLNPSSCVLVFRPNKRDCAVVLLSNGKFVADVYQFTYQDNLTGVAGGFTDVVNPSGSVIVRSCPIFDENHQLPLGSFFGLELPTRDANGNLQNDSLIGTALYGIPDQGVVYGVSVSTGRRIVDTSGG